MDTPQVTPSIFIPELSLVHDGLPRKLSHQPSNNCFQDIDYLLLLKFRIHTHILENMIVTISGNPNINAYKYHYT